VTAIDISDTLLDRFRARVEGKNLPLAILKADAHDIPATDASFDTVVARMFLPHFPDWPKLLREIARVTKPGGQILVHFPSKENKEAALRIGGKASEFSTDPDTNDPWSYYSEANARDLSAAAERLGLRVIERVPVSFFAHNRIIGHQIGKEAYDRYQSELPDQLADERVREFVVWFDMAVTANAGPAFSYFSVVAFAKIG
jgi:SAM-dependent methyltransferase